MFELLKGRVPSLFFPQIFRAWDTGFVLLAHTVLGAEGKPSGNISGGGKKEFWGFPPDRSFLCQILLPWLWSQGTLVWAGKRHIQTGNEFFLEKFSQSLGWEGWRKERVGKAPFPGTEQGLGHLSPTPHQLFLLVVKGGLNFLTGMFWSFPRSGEDWAELEVPKVGCREGGGARGGFVGWESQGWC